MHLNRLFYVIALLFASEMIFWVIFNSSGTIELKNVTKLTNQKEANRIFLAYKHRSGFLLAWADMISAAIVWGNAAELSSNDETESERADVRKRITNIVYSKLKDATLLSAMTATSRATAMTNIQCSAVERTSGILSTVQTSRTLAKKMAAATVHLITNSNTNTVQANTSTNENIVVGFMHAYSTRSKTNSQNLATRPIDEPVVSNQNIASKRTTRSMENETIALSPICTRSKKAVQSTAATNFIPAVADAELPVAKHPKRAPSKKLSSSITPQNHSKAAVQSSDSAKSIPVEASMHSTKSTNKNSSGSIAIVTRSVTRKLALQKRNV